MCNWLDRLQRVNTDNTDPSYSKCRDMEVVKQLLTVPGIYRHRNCSEQFLAKQSLHTHFCKMSTCSEISNSSKTMLSTLANFERLSLSRGSGWQEYAIQLRSESAYDTMFGLRGTQLAAVHRADSKLGQFRRRPSMAPTPGLCTRRS